MNRHNCVAENAIHREGHRPYKRRMTEALDEATVGKLHVLAWRLEQQAKGRRK